MLFSSDTIFSDVWTVSHSISWPEYNGQDYCRSLSELASLEFQVLCSSHGAPLLVGASDQPRSLLATHSELPTWGQIFKHIPRYLSRLIGQLGQAV